MLGVVRSCFVLLSAHQADYSPPCSVGTFLGQTYALLCTGLVGAYFRPFLLYRVHGYSRRRGSSFLPSRSPFLGPVGRWLVTLFVARLPLMSALS